MRDATALSGPECRIAIITAETEAFPDMRHFLLPRFEATLAQSEKQIQSAVDDGNIRAILIDLDSMGGDPSNALQLLRDIRQIRQDIALVAITRSNSLSIPLEASKAGTDEFFLAPLDFHELQIVLWRAIEKRSLQVEGQRVVEQAENKTSF